MTDDVELLCRVETIGPERADTLLDAFGDGRGVAMRAVSGWGAIANVDGCSEDWAKQLYDRMLDAGVYKELRYGGDPS